ncbi:MAG: hypothetical protein JWM68_1668 [Verrucomicrobiales bacterium]|nr:hypothetical protein [Verrucomicrobiales bacterium]
MKIQNANKSQTGDTRSCYSLHRRSPLAAIVMSLLLVIVTLTLSAQAPAKAKIIRGEAIDAAVPDAPAPADATAATATNSAASTGNGILSAGATTNGTTLAAPDTKSNLKGNQRGNIELGFDLLAGFKFSSYDPIEKVLEGIPANVRSLNNSLVEITGFMVPLRYEDGLVTQFLLMRNQMLCCYGKTPKVHEWVTVEMVGKGIDAIKDVPITVLGTFHVGDVVKNNQHVAIYRLEGEKQIESKK